MGVIEIVAAEKGSEPSNGGGGKRVDVLRARDLLNPDRWQKESDLWCS